MLTPILVVGSLFIALGLIIKKAPQLIAGFNRVRKENKEHLVSLVQKGSLITGAIIIIGGGISYLLDLDVLAFLILFMMPFLMVIWLQFQLIEKGSTKKRTNTSPIAIIVLLSVLLVSCLVGGYLSYKEADARIADGKLNITGIYGESIAIDSIESVLLLEFMPKINSRTDGFNLAKVRKGQFQLEGFGESTLFLHSDVPPLVHITTKNGRHILINSRNFYETVGFFRQLESSLH